MKKLISFCVMATAIAIITAGCCSKCNSGKCAMCTHKVHSGKCLVSDSGTVDYPCASYCMMCKKCKMVISPEKAKECKNICPCGAKMVPMKSMSYQDMCKFNKEQGEHTYKCCMCNGKIHKLCCIKTTSGVVGKQCASQCMMCEKCKMVMTPTQAEARKNICCGKQMVPLGNMSSKEIDKLCKEQTKCVKKKSCSDKCQ